MHVAGDSFARVYKEFFGLDKPARLPKLYR